MTAKDLLPFLEAVRRTRDGYMARCPAHDDRHPSLSIREGDRAVLVKCWAGCHLSEVTAAIGLRVPDLFYDAVTTPGRRVAKKPAVVDRVALAFNYEMMALDYHVRSTSVLQQIAQPDFSSLADSDQDRLIAQAGAAYFNRESAARLESIADSLRLAAFNPDVSTPTCSVKRVA